MKSIQSVIKESGLKISPYSVDGSYDYREVYYIWPRFCQWRNQKLEDKKYKFKEEKVGKDGNLLISKEEIELYLEEDKDNIFKIVNK